MTAPLLDCQSEWARMIFAAFAEAGVRDVVVSPGSRSTPFALAAAVTPRLRLCSILDERAAAFYALGQGRASGRPSLLLCTSGSAPAHYLPAIIEARHSRTPLIALTADRPLEAQHAGAHQTIDQTRMFGAFVEASYELGAVDAAPAALRGVRRLVAQAVARSLGEPAGAVHLNVRARKPLEPHEPVEPHERAAAERIRAIAGTPLVTVRERAAPQPTALEALARRIAETDEGLIVVGPAPARDRALEPTLVRLAELAGYPIVIEPTSQLLGAAHPAFYPGLLSTLYAASAGRGAARPRLILQVGGAAVASGYEAVLGEAPAPRLEVIARELEADADSRAAAIHLGEPAILLDALGKGLSELGVSRRASAWLEQVRASADRARHALAGLVEQAAPDDELGAITALLAAVRRSPAPPTVFVGNSLPVRELALAAAITEGGPLAVLHQRGASGIDGLCAGACGIESIVGPTLLLIGDVSLLHDLSGLYLAQRAGALVIAVVANGGGRIFETLPVGRREDLAATMDLFTTPVDPDLETLARFSGLRYACAATRDEVGPAVTAALEHQGATLLELRVAPKSAASLSAAFPGALAKALK